LSFLILFFIWTKNFFDVFLVFIPGVQVPIVVSFFFSEKNKNVCFCEGFKNFKNPPPDSTRVKLLKFLWGMSIFENVKKWNDQKKKVLCIFVTFLWKCLMFWFVNGKIPIPKSVLWYKHCLGSCMGVKKKTVEIMFWCSGDVRRPKNIWSPYDL